MTKDIGFSAANSGVMLNAYAFDQDFAGLNARGVAMLNSNYLGVHVIGEAGLGLNTNTFIPYGYNGTFAYDYQFAQPTITHAVLSTPNIKFGSHLVAYAKVGKIDIVQYQTSGGATTDGNSSTTAYGGNYWVPRNYYNPGILAGAQVTAGDLSLTLEGMQVNELVEDENDQLQLGASLLASGNTYSNVRLVGSVLKNDQPKATADISVGQNLITRVDQGDQTPSVHNKQHFISAFTYKVSDAFAGTMTFNGWQSGSKDVVTQSAIELIPQVNANIPLPVPVKGFTFDVNAAYALALHMQHVNTAGITDQSVQATSNGWDDDVPGTTKNKEGHSTSTDNQIALLTGVTYNLPQVGSFGQSVSVGGMLLADASKEAPLLSEDQTYWGGRAVYTGKFK